MACPDGTTIQYDVDMRTNPVSGQVKIDERLTFCLIITSGAISGTIEQLPGVILKGTNRDLGDQVDRITLQFDWSPSRIDLQGFTFPAAGGRRRFLAEFNAVEPAGGSSVPDDSRATQAALPPPGPDVGDTGTGNGTTT